MTRIFHKLTFIPAQAVWVSTVAYDHHIGIQRSAETMVFRGNESGITNFEDIDYESLGYTDDENALQEAHERMLVKWRARA